VKGENKMGTHITKETFEFLYNNTYKNVLKYTICHCKNLDDVNDIIQDIYTELYQKIIIKKHINLDNVESYIIGIAKNKIKGHYASMKKIYQMETESENLEQLNSNEIDIEKDLITKDNVMQVWSYLKSKGGLTAKIFYLYYVMDIPIKTIAEDLKITESNVKNHLYRTQKELKKNFMKGENYNVR
jgi:RNA polymerase sigma-70 factor (ECF subfamily)